MNDWIVEQPPFEEDLMNSKYTMLNQNGINKVIEIINEKDKEIERLNNIIKDQRLLLIEFQDMEQRLKEKDNIINETSEILKFHLSNPSQTINGWHIDIWNSEDIKRLNKMLNIIEIKEEK